MKYYFGDDTFMKLTFIKMVNKEFLFFGFGFRGTSKLWDLEVWVESVFFLCMYINFACTLKVF